MIVGLAFFIKASVKDRTKTLSFALTEPEEEFLPKLDRYFVDRAYRLVDVSERTGVTYAGTVAPSIFLAVFLSLLGAIGLLCLGLVGRYTVAGVAGVWWLPALLSPLAGVFYWQRASRQEQVSLAILEGSPHKTITVTGHRDELQQLEKALAIENV